jgi:hypothetical protein
MNVNRTGVTRNRWASACGGLCTMLMACVEIGGSARASAAVAEPTAPPGYGNAVAYDLKETSAFDLPPSVRIFFVMGHPTVCQREPNEQVRRYPEFKSSQPLYGSLRVGVPYGSRDPGLCHQYAVDESGGTGRGYDRLYLDVNLNGDLTDDGPGQRPRSAPEGLYPAPNFLKASACFDPLRIRIDPKNNAPRIEIMPYLYMLRGIEDRVSVAFIPTKVRVSLLRLGHEEFQAFLGYDRSLAGGLDHPSTPLHFIHADRPNGVPGSWTGGRTLASTHRQGDVFYRLSAAPEGDKLFVRQYEGPLGTFEIQAGGRDITDFSISGSVADRDTTVAFAEDLGSGSVTPVRSCRLPVGDYNPYVLDVAYGQLTFSVARNTHEDGQPRARILDPRNTGTIRIRADKPFVLDFSGKPQVLFASPARDHRVKLGDTLDVKAVLIDPARDFMFSLISYEKKTLNPTVAIKRASGAMVAEGVMPFG